MPAGGHYFWDVFPALIVTGIGLGLTFVPVTIAALQGVSPADAGIASGLINTTRQIGGAVGIAAVTTIAATVAANDTGVTHAEALTHGFHAAFYALAAIALLGCAHRCGIPRPDSHRGRAGPARRRGHPRRGRVKGGTMETTSTFRELDDLVMHLKGLVMVRRLREESGAGSDELGMFSAEIDTVRNRLATLVASRPRV